VPWRQPPWSERFPRLAAILDADPSIPRRNELVGNFAVANTAFARKSAKPESLPGFVFADNLEYPQDDVFRDAAGLDFSPRRPDTGLPAIDLSTYGLQLDEFRRTLPPRDLAMLRSGDTKRKKFDSQQDVDAYRR
jgi:hypothetical protein